VPLPTLSPSKAPPQKSLSVKLLRVSDIRSKERLETYEIYFDRQADVAYLYRKD
jgi:hypothetical protein